jgi:signal peptidase I
LVLGDNRNNSHDSRMWFGGQGGGVPRDSIRGYALTIWLSVKEDGIDRTRLGMGFDVPTLPRDAAGLAPRLEACLRDRPSAEKATPPSAAR